MAEKEEKILNAAVHGLMDWYAANARPLPWRRDRSAYHIWISEIMLQQTRIEAVIGYYERFLARFPTVRDIAVCDDDSLMKVWEGLGYYSRARHIKRAAEIMVEQYDGMLPQTKEALQSLPGIGDYTAAAIASMAFGESAAAVDGNVLRVCSRLLDDPRDVMLPATKKAVTALLGKVIPADAPGAFNEAMMELGETICLPSAPGCTQCPLRDHCLALERGTVAERPIRNPKVSKKIEKMTVFVLIEEDGSVAVRQRPTEGLLAGLYEFPHVNGHLSASKAKAHLGSSYIIKHIERLPDHTHVFTHKKWLMRGYLAQVQTKKKDGSCRFVPPEKLLSTYPVPTAFAPYRAAIDEIPAEPGP